MSESQAKKHSGSVACPICGAAQHRFIWRHKNRLFGGELSSELRQCACGMLLTCPQPDDDALGRLYEPDAYYTHHRALGWRARVRAAIRWSQTRKPLYTVRLYAEDRLGFRRHLTRLAPHDFELSGGMRFLDFGCGGGQTLALARDLGASAVGLEPDPKARAVASSSGISVHGSLADLGDQTFDRILLSHVLEHLRHPRRTLAELRTRLRPEGKILIRVPNAASAQAEAFGPFWIGYDMPRHLWHFNVATLSQLLEQCGFRVRHIATLELPHFASCSAAEMRKDGKVPAKYQPDRKSVEASGRGAELLAVAESAN